MFIKLKLLIVFLSSIGAFPFVAFGLFDFGILVADMASLFTLVVLVELFLGSLMLIKIAYKPSDETVKAFDSKS